MTVSRVHIGFFQSLPWTGPDYAQRLKAKSWFVALPATWKPEPTLPVTSLIRHVARNKLLSAMLSRYEVCDGRC